MVGKDEEDEEKKLLIGSDDDDDSNYQANSWASDELKHCLHHHLLNKNVNVQNVSLIRWRSGHLPQNKQRIDTWPMLIVEAGFHIDAWC